MVTIINIRIFKTRVKYTNSIITSKKLGKNKVVMIENYH